MSTATQFSIADLTPTASDPFEIEVQRILTLIGDAPNEVQTTVVARLLSGLSTKLPSGLAAKAIEVAKVPPGEAPKKRARKEQPQPNYDPQLEKLRDPFDPIEAWEKLGGSDGLKTILPYEATGILETMLRHPNMPPGPKPKSNTKATIAKNIIVRLETYFSQH